MMNFAQAGDTVGVGPEIAAFFGISLLVAFAIALLFGSTNKKDHEK